MGLNRRETLAQVILGRSTDPRDRSDDVDLSREVAGDFESNFLLTNLRLAPNFHGLDLLG